MIASSADFEVRRFRLTSAPHYTTDTFQNHLINLIIVSIFPLTRRPSSYATQKFDMQ